MAIVYEHSLHLAQTPREVFAFLDDYAKAPLWLERCEGVAKQGSGPNKAGDKLRYAYNESGKHGLMDGVILTHESEREMTFRYFDKMMSVFVAFHMEADDQGGTRLTHRIEITPNSFMAKLMTPLVRMRLPKQTVMTMQKLKACLAKQVDKAK